MSSQCYVLYVLYCTYLRLGYGLYSSISLNSSASAVHYSLHGGDCSRPKLPLELSHLPAEPALARSLMYDQGLSGLLWCYGCQYCHVHIALAAELQRPILNGSVVVC
eukprot:scpid104531/ scgid10326/ 